MESHKIVLVDDDFWRRYGVQACLADLGGILEVTAHVTHEEALNGFAWTPTDLVIVDAVGRSEGWDRFTGIGVASRILEVCGAQQRLVLMVPEEQLQVLALRAHEAGIEEIATWSGHEHPDDLERLALIPDMSRSPARQLRRETIAGMGLSSSSRPNAALAFIAEQGLTELFLEGRSLSRRRTITLRRALTEVLRVDAVGVDGAPLRDRSMPTWRQLLDVTNRLRGQPFGLSWYGSAYV